MQTHPPGKRSRLLMTVALGLAGAGINLVKLPLFFGVDFLFGSIASLTAAILFGPLHGLAAAVLTALPTLHHWHHPYALLIFGLEGLIVGRLVQRDRERVIEAQLLYWTFLGGPLVFFTYFALLDLPLAAVTTVAVKQPLNALLNAVISSAFVHLCTGQCPARHGGRRSWPIRAYLVHAVTIVATLPVLIGSVWYGTWFARHIQEDLKGRARQTGRIVQEQVRTWAQDHIGAVGVVAGSIDSLAETERLQRLLADAHMAFPDFHNLYVGDTTATAIAFHPPENDKGEPTVGLTFADRPYYQRAKRAFTPFVTGAFQGRGGTDEVIVNIVAPIRSQIGEFRGYVVGAVNLGRLQQRVDAHAATAEPAVVILVDSLGQVVIANNEDRWPQMAPFQLADLGRVTELDGNLLQVLPPDGSAMAAWLSGYFGWVETEPNTGWRIVTLLPIGPEMADLYQVYAIIMGSGYLLVIAAVIVIRILNRLVTRPLEQLASVARQSLTAPDASWPPRGRFAEINDLVSSLSDAAGKLRAAQQRLAFLAEASDQLAASLDHRQTLRSLAGLITRDFADVCAVWLIHPEDPAPQLIALEASEGCTADLDPLRQCCPRVLDPRFLSATGPVEPPAAEDPCRAVVSGIESGVMLPLLMRTGARGVIFLGRGAERPPFDGDDRELAQNLADRATLAVENALLYERSVHEAMHDGLTGLPNRAHFLERIGEALMKARGAEERVAVLFIDLDGFKLVNDRLGHHAGDLLLQKVADRLRGFVGELGTTARLGGDEFGVLLPAVGSAEAALGEARRIIRELDAPFAVFGQEFFVRASAGIALGSASQSPAELVRFADIAVYQARREEDRRVQLYSPALGEQTERRLRLETDLHYAVYRGQLRLHYQPVIALGSRQVSSLEALIRWEHPALGMVSPAEFIPLAERSGAMVSIGRWLMEEACRQVQAWRSTVPGADGLKLSVNLSPRELRAPDLLQTVAGALRASQLPPSALQVELTESEAMQTAGAVEETLRRLKELGVSVAVDDFGTGYASLSYLQRFPVDVLKIDQSFIADLNRNQPLVRTVITLARALDLAVVAEGVETPEQEGVLREMSCDFGQGYLYARPLPAEEMGRFLRTWPQAGD